MCSNGRWLSSFIAIEGKEIAPHSLQNSSDPDAMYRKKGGKKHVGYSLNLVEDHSLSNEIETLSVDGAYYRVETVEKAKEKEDRKSTRLNSSHVAISYAVFCLKKK